jgi:hypothetical protein
VILAVTQYPICDLWSTVQLVNYSGVDVMAVVTTYLLVFDRLEEHAAYALWNIQHRTLQLGSDARGDREGYGLVEVCTEAKRMD